MEIRHYFLPLHQWMDFVGCLGPSVDRVPVPQQNAVSHYYGVPLGPEFC
jgi:hypothetical protein